MVGSSEDPHTIGDGKKSIPSPATSSHHVQVCMQFGHTRCVCLCVWKAEWSKHTARQLELRFIRSASVARPCSTLSTWQSRA